MTLKRSAFAVAAVGASLMLALSACSDGTGTQEAPPRSADDTVRIAYLAGFTNHDWAQVGVNAAKAKAESMNATLEVFDAQSDPAKQYAQIQDLITTQRFDSIVIMPVDGASIVPAVEEAIGAGLAVVDVAFPVGTDLTTRESQVKGMAGSVVLSPQQNGRTLADIVIQACGDKNPCKAAILPGSLTVSADAARVKEIEAVLGKTSNIKIVAMQETGYTTDGAFGVAKTILTANPDLDIFLAIGSESVVGAERAVIDAGLEGKVKLGGGACSTNATTALKEGRFFACYRGTPIEDNEAAVELAVKAVRGEKIENRSPDPGALAWPEIITRENLGNRVGEWTD